MIFKLFSYMNYFSLYFIIHWCCRYPNLAIYFGVLLDAFGKASPCKSFCSALATSTSPCRGSCTSRCQDFPWAMQEQSGWRSGWGWGSESLSKPTGWAPSCLQCNINDTQTESDTCLHYFNEIFLCNLFFHFTIFHASFQRQLAPSANMRLAGALDPESRNFSCQICAIWCENASIWCRGMH